MSSVRIDWSSPIISRINVSLAGFGAAPGEAAAACIAASIAAAFAACHTRKPGGVMGRDEAFEAVVSSAFKWRHTS